MCWSDGRALCPALLAQRTEGYIEHKNSLGGSSVKLLAGNLPFLDCMMAHKIAFVPTSVKLLGGHFPLSF